MKYRISKYSEEKNCLPKNINFFDFVYEDEILRNALINTLKLIINTKKDSFDFETYIDMKGVAEYTDNLTKRLINWGVSFVYTEDGELDKLLLIGTDITSKTILEDENQQMAIDVKLKNLELEEINNQLEQQNETLKVLNQKNELLQSIIRLYTPRSTWTRAHISIERGEIEIPQEELELTMVFGDIQNFTKFSERHTAIDTIATLNELFHIVSSYVYYFDGDIDKFIGDAFFAIFTDPRNAILASVKINMALDELNDDRMMSGKEPLFVRLGINTGKVVRGNVGG